MIYLCI